MKKAVINFICIFLCFLIPFIAIGAMGFIIPTQFDRTFLGELHVKTDRLYSIKEPKIIVIGGSSVPFGVDSKLMEQALGMPVVNFGLYATLGTKLMLDLSKGAIREGDIIVLAPETDPQTYSLYFNAESVWQACDSDFSILTKMSADNFGDMLGGYWKFVAQKFKYSNSDSHLDPSGVYNVASFDEYGDIVYDRPYNVMAADFDSSLTIRFDSGIIDSDFIDYVNEYTKYAEKKGAKVYFSFAPMNEKAVDENTTLEDLESFTSFIDEKFIAERISDPNDYLYRSGYFYDSNFHMNNAGTVMHTRTLVNDLAAALEIEPKIKIEKPKVPEKPKEDDKPLEYDENEKYFTFTESTVNGKVAGYIISGTTELGKSQTVLTTPNAYNGMHIFSIAENTFAGCDRLTEIYISKGVAAIGDGAFAGADGLKKVHVLSTDPNATTVNNVSGELCKGMASGVKFHVPKDSYMDYVGNYFWGPYMDYIVAETD